MTQVMNGSRTKVALIIEAEGKSESGRLSPVGEKGGHVKVYGE